MDFSALYQLKLKKILLVDIIFYFSLSLLTATVFCYLLFIAKIHFQNIKIGELDDKIAEIGTEYQKQYEDEIFDKQKKIKDFSSLMQDHKISSSSFAFLEQITLPNVWFSRFSMSEKSGEISLAGETNTMDSLSQQVSLFEKNEYVKKIVVLDSNMGESGRISFNLKLSLDPKIFKF